ncbi:hypothetical protein DL768_004799 [Monosporascus sp. mg162]|nr:hypothetical protein DL768_004799 [Monosporascus sp. mg162]
MDWSTEKDRRWTNEDIRWTCAECGHDNNSYIYDLHCPSCNTRRDASSSFWTREENYRPLHNQTPVSQDKRVCLPEESLSGIGYCPLGSKDTVVGAQERKGLPTTSDSPTPLDSTLNFDNILYDVNSYLSDSSYSPLGGETSLEFLKLFVDFEPLALQADEQGVNTAEVPGSKSGQFQITEASSSGHDATPCVSSVVQSDSPTISTDGEAEASNSPISSPMPAPRDVMGLEWLLPLRNHPSFPEILEAWNGFIKNVTGHDDQDTPRAPSASAGSSFPSQSFPSTSSNQCNRKRPLGDDVDDKGPGSSKTRAQHRPPPEPGKDGHFACHFLKLDVKTYPQCLSVSFKDMRTTTQHLRQKHENQVTPERLPKGLGRGESECDRWYLTWDKLFPGGDRPKSPYASPVEDVMLQFVDYVRGNNPEFYAVVRQCAAEFISGGNQGSTAVEMVTPLSVVADGRSSSSPTGSNEASRPDIPASLSEETSMIFSHTELSTPTLGTLEGLFPPLDTSLPLLTRDGIFELEYLLPEFLGNEYSVATNDETTTNPPDSPASPNKVYQAPGDEPVVGVTTAPFYDPWTSATDEALLGSGLDNELRTQTTQRTATPPETTGTTSAAWYSAPTSNPGDTRTEVPNSWEPDPMLSGSWFPDFNGHWSSDFADIASAPQPLAPSPSMAASILDYGPDPHSYSSVPAAREVLARTPSAPGSGSVVRIAPPPSVQWSTLLGTTSDPARRPGFEEELGGELAAPGARSPSESSEAEADLFTNPDPDPPPKRKKKCHGSACRDMYGD